MSIGEQVSVQLFRFNNRTMSVRELQSLSAPYLLTSQQELFELLDRQTGTTDSTAHRESINWGWHEES
jgi:hypothetical protein